MYNACNLKNWTFPVFFAPSKNVTFPSAIPGWSRSSHDVRGIHLHPGALPQHQAALPILRQLRDALLVGPGHHQTLVDPRAQGHQEPQQADVPSGEGDIGQEGHGIEDLSSEELMLGT